MDILEPRDILTAIDECKINDEYNALIVGNEYEIIEAYSDGIVVHSEYKDNHFFYVGEIRNLFSLPVKVNCSEVPKGYIPTLNLDVKIKDIQAYEDYIIYTSHRSYKTNLTQIGVRELLIENE